MKTVQRIKFIPNHAPSCGCEDEGGKREAEEVPTARCFIMGTAGEKSQRLAMALVIEAVIQYMSPLSTYVSMNIGYQQDFPCL
jgi:hypothetical protein